MEQIKLLELFSGIQSQEKAIRALKIPYESVGVCECDKDCLVASAAMRFNLQHEIDNYNFPSQDKMIEELQEQNIGYSFEKEKHTITKRTPINKLRQIYISNKLLKNIGDISLVKRLPYADLVTYSSPCQSFSVAGNLGGAAKTCKECGHKWDIDFSNPDYNYKCPNCGSVSLESTTSGLLQEVQRLLSVAYENNELPKYLMLENVKNLVGKQFKPQFDAWVRWLDSIGYNTYYKVLNAKRFGIPQNRERVFAISIRKDIDIGFTFPDEIPLTTRLKDMLEKEVDEKFYLNDDRINSIINSTFMQEKKRIQQTDVCDTLLARDWKDPKCVPVEEPFCVASRGRNPENPSDRTVGAPTEQRLEPNFSGCTNTITSVQKDNYIAEPIIYDDYNSRIPQDQDAITTLTTNCGASAARNGVKIIEPIVCEERRDEGIRLFKDDCVGTLRTIDACGDKRVIEPEVHQIGNVMPGKNRPNPNQGRVYDDEGLAPTLTKMDGGNRQPMIVDDIQWKIRKLTPLECLRLMNFTDEDYRRCAQYISNSAVYKQSGNSIVVAVLIALFSSLFILDGHKAEVWTQYMLHFADK